MSPKPAKSRSRRGTGGHQIKPLQTSHSVCIPLRLLGVHPSAEVNFAIPIDFWVVSSLSWHSNILKIFLTLLTITLGSVIVPISQMGKWLWAGLHSRWASLNSKCLPLVGGSFSGWEVPKINDIHPFWTPLSQGFYAIKWRESQKLKDMQLTT
jgi:hypothetical protein